MLSVSSALLLLSIQQVSIHAYLKPWRAALAHVFLILDQPCLEAAERDTNSWKETSSASSHVCERIAYLGVSEPKNSSRSRLLVLMSHMMASENWELGIDEYTLQACDQSSLR